MNITYPLTIYYDASCPMCKAEMETLKETDKQNKLILVDCSDSNMETPASCPITKEAMMTRIHAIDANGVWIKGVDVFSPAYDAAGFKKLSQFWGSPLLRPILSRLYPIIADNKRWLSKTPLPRLINQTLRHFSK